MHGRGCNYCHLTGYRGRIGVYELIEMDSKLTEALRNEDLDAFISLATRKDNFVSLASCALDYAIKGITSVEEVIRVTGGLDDTETHNDEVSEVNDG